MQHTTNHASCALATTSLTRWAALLLVGGLGGACDAEAGRDDGDALGENDDEGEGGKADDANGGAGSAFDRTRIVSDAAMLDPDAFTAAEIDAFLADPDDDGLASCLTTERFGGKTPGTLIRETATKYGLNPLFLVTHLQMKSALVDALGTCSQALMDEAFDCGCSDGAQCAPESLGFANQLECAGDLTRSYLDDLDAGQTTVSGWGVGTAKSTLDPYTVTPQNKATAVLYTYTPWVGDQNAGGNAAPFGNYLFWQVWTQYAKTLGYTAPGDGPPPPSPSPSEMDPGGLADWTYILNTDYGLRSDGLGQGHFQAPRSGGRLHNGIDILGQRGEPLYAPCSGEALSGFDGAFGNWVQLVCPVQLAGQTYFASMLYAHLDQLDVGGGGWQDVDKETRVGKLGATGNASSTNAHVHFEIVFHANRSAALNELHNGNDTATNATSTTVLAILEDECLEPNGLNSKNPTDIIRYGRRFDPYLALTCLGAKKVALTTPPASLQSQVERWSKWYRATTFDVDTGHL